MRSEPYRYAFGDEAGDTGFTLTSRSSRFFLVTLLLLDDPEPLQQRVERLRQELGLPAHVEFKFHKTSKVYRQVFLKALEPYDFVVRALCADKTALPVSFRRMKDREFYAFCFGELFRRIPAGELGQTILTLDQFGASRTTLRELRCRLKEQGNVPRPFKKLSFRRSKGDNLLQAVDMIGGAIYRELTRGDDSYLDLVRSKVFVVWGFEAHENPPS
nr:DUF3800 domain-containing protein [Anaerolineales bacterium]